MKIETDREGGTVLLKLCDAALRAVGLNAFSDVSLVLNELRKNDATLKYQGPGGSGEDISLAGPNGDGKPDEDRLRAGAQAKDKAR